MKRTLTDLSPAALSGRTVVVRADLNAPLADGRVADDQRLVASIPTIRHLQDAGARVVVLTHLGRPKGEANPAYSTAPVATRLEELLGRPVTFVPASVGSEVREAVSALPEGGIALLENTRYLPGETSNDPELGAAWAELGDLFVNDAFGTAHRAHASTAGLALAMKEKGGEAVAGLLMAKELRFLEEALRAPPRPFVAIIGGAKISGKIDVISSLLPRVDRLLIGGAMANTFFRALGLDTGASLVEEDAIGTARELLEQGGDTLVLPLDCIVTDRIAEGATFRPVHRDRVEAEDRIVDIGPDTRALYADMAERARTIVWNGPMGVFEVADFAAGTIAVAEAVARACDGGGLGVVGGGDSAAAARRAGVFDRLTHVSTGGGASLDLLAGATLPAVEALSDLPATSIREGT